jgi:hypothetical protein
MCTCCTQPEPTERRGQSTSCCNNGKIHAQTREVSSKKKNLRLKIVEEKDVVDA